MIDQARLSQRLQSMSRHPHVDADLLAKFGDAVASEDDWGLFRINPLRFAKKHGFAPDVAVDLMVLGAREGLFDMAFLEVCAWCGLVTHDVAGWGGLAADHFGCQMCRTDVDAALDGSIAVVFTVASAVRKLELNPYADFGSYLRFHLFSAFTPGSAVMSYFQSLPSGWAALPPGASTTVELDTGDLPELFVGSYELASSALLPLEPGGPLDVNLQLDAGGGRFDVVSAGRGRLRLTIRNGTPRTAGFRAFARDPAKLVAAVMETPPSWSSFVNARDLLSQQRFRELYRLQDVPRDLRLRVGSLTLLFTDLSGSTALYDSTGDVTAFDIVREHFALLTDCVRHHGGAVVKTMGDAVMASFPHPDQAIEAARDMLDAMEPVTERARKFGHKLGLKVGIHEGSALVVNADERLDYFGQTVNVAARVQGLAAAGEIWLTRPVFETAGRSLTDRGFAAETRQVPLKGVEGLVDVVRLSRAA